MYTFSFPYFNQKPEVRNGMVVSLDENGYVFTGAGTTISQNVTRSEIRYGQDVDDIRVCAWDENIVFTGSKGMLVAFEISYDDIPIDNPSFTLPQVNGKSRNVESLYRIGDNTLAVVGSGQILPVTVKVTDTSGGKQMSFHIDFEAKAENAFTFAEDGDNAYPHCDDLKDSNRKDMIACTFERNHMLVTTVFTLQSDGKFVRTNEVEYAKQRQYHGLAGCGPEGYLVAAVGSDWDDTEHGGIGPISVAYVAIRNGAIHVGEFRNMTFESSIGFFSLDNVMQNGAVMCYTRLASGGIDCVNLAVTYGPEGGVPDYVLEKIHYFATAHYAGLEKAYKAGVKIVCGTDTGTPFNCHGDGAEELEMYTKLCMSPMEAIKTATSMAAQALRQPDIGVLAAGKTADVLVVKGDVLANIALLQNKADLTIIHNGKLVTGTL